MGSVVPWWGLALAGWLPAWPEREGFALACDPPAVRSSCHGWTFPGPRVAADPFAVVLSALSRAGGANVPSVGAVCLPATGRGAVDRAVIRVYVSILIDAREIESIAGTAGETLAGRADVSVSLLAAVADPIRWTVLERLASQPSCVCNLQEHVPIAANLLSYHLKVLREAGLVTTRRRGRWIDYALAEDALDRLRAALPGVVTGTAVPS